MRPIVKIVIKNVENGQTHHTKFQAHDIPHMCF